MRVTVEPSVVEGVLKAPPSKSWAQRAVFLALLADGKSEFANLPQSDDVKASLEAVKAFGAEVEGHKIVGGKVMVPENVIDMRGSGTGARIAIAMGTLVPRGFGAVITGNRSLRRRPMGPVVDLLRGLGADVRSLRGDKLPVVSFGGLPGGEVETDGRVTSQHVTAALIAGSASELGVAITIKNPVSRGYIALTEEVLKDFGVRVECASDYTRCSVKPTRPRPIKRAVPGDYALAAFPAVAAAISGGEVKIEGLPAPREGPGDHKLIDYLRRFGVDVEYSSGSLRVRGDRRPVGTRVNVRDEPDLALPLAALAAVSKGESVISGISHLAYKESDRIRTIMETLSCFGVKSKVDGSSLRIWGSERLRRCELTCPDDHRVAMMASLLGLVAGTVIEKAECVAKSWPEYWEVLRGIGGKVYVEGEKRKRVHQY
ncbi:MAG: 3-phosphoshikimate 1-carboxyvinyltransferase [Crenarchaeota archaeon]|nr:3-phosphoshikimate 1-carboxyvinyltransferase [Thermoproteota archaeon]